MLGKIGNVEKIMTVFEEGKGGRTKSSTLSMSQQPVPVLVLLSGQQVSPSSQHVLPSLQSWCSAPQSPSNQPPPATTEVYQPNREKSSVTKVVFKWILSHVKGENNTWYSCHSLPSITTCKNAYL